MLKRFNEYVQQWDNLNDEQKRFYFSNFPQPLRDIPGYVPGIHSEDEIESCLKIYDCWSGDDGKEGYYWQVESFEMNFRSRYVFFNRFHPEAVEFYKKIGYCEAVSLEERPIIWKDETDDVWSSINDNAWR